MQFNRGETQIRSDIDSAMVKYFRGETSSTDENDFSIFDGCSGAFISSRTIVTAAHCFKKYETKNELLLMPNNQKGERIVARSGSFRIHSHPLYNPETIDPTYDLALIVFESEFHTGSVLQISPFLIPDLQNSRQNSSFYIFGGGARNIPLTTHDRENAFYEYLLNEPVKGAPVSFLQSINPEVFRFLTIPGVKVCQGDSGGALVHNNTSGEINLIGVNAVVSPDRFTYRTRKYRLVICTRTVQVSLLTPEKIQWIINNAS